jgi:WS/DGAT/MGAT family acyltransferase
MHVGWAAVFEPPANSPRPSFEALREHVSRRLGRSTRYRQRLERVPLGVHDPVWVDDPSFDLDMHLFAAHSSSLDEVVHQAMSVPLDRSRPLWELWIAPRLSDGRIGVVGKAHHCMVDGLAAVELAGLLLDPSEVPARLEPDRWRPGATPAPWTLLADAVADRAGEQLELVRWQARLASSRGRLMALARDAQRAGAALAHTFADRAPASPLNKPISPLRHLAMVSRPLAELKIIKRRYGTTINDVVLSVSAGAVRRFLEDRGQQPIAVKAMVPVSVRGGEDGSILGNRIAFMFMGLPCQEPHPVHRLLAINRVTSERKRSGEPRGAEAIFDVVSRTPHVVQRIVTRLVTSPRTFNLVVSNIPGPAEESFMNGCRLAEAYPVVPIADSHALSIGFTTVNGRACFGLYADRRSLPDCDVLAGELDREIEVLLTHASGDGRDQRHRSLERPPTPV